MDNRNVYLAVDLGATSGRVMAGIWSTDTLKLELETIHRFPSPAIRIDGHLHWDVLAIFDSIKEGLSQAAALYGDRIVSVGVDSWAVDYALVDANGSMLGNPYHYRDSRTDGMMDAVQKRVSREDIYDETGIQFLFINTIYQLYATAQSDAEGLLTASRLLFIPDLMSYWLSGSRHQERTVASTSQLLNPITGNWSGKLLDSLELPAGLFDQVVEPGAKVGSILPEIREETGLGNVSVIAVAGHDTASAFVALPGASEGFAVMSSGTWSLMGLELMEPRLGSDALCDGFSNEVGYDGTIRFLKNICGMWLIEECRRHWEAEGRRYEYDAIVELAKRTPAMVSLIDPDAPEFAAPENMLEAIREFCRRTDQGVPEDDAAMIRCIFDSLALKYRYVFKKLEAYSPVPLEGLFVLGGGARNQLLNQMTADALGVAVVSGPPEATAVGNVAVQIIATGALGDLSAARDMVKNSFASEVFEPCDTEAYEAVFPRFEALFARGDADT